MPPDVTRRRVLAALAGTAGVGLVAASAVDTESQPGAKASPCDRIKPDWEYQSREGPGEMVSPATVHDGSVLVTPGYTVTDLPDGSVLASIEAETKRKEWRFENLRGGLGVPLVDSETAYIVTGAPSVYAVERGSGTPRWQYKPGFIDRNVNAFWYRPTLVGETLVVGLSNWISDEAATTRVAFEHRLIGIDTDSGEKRWETELDGRVSTGLGGIDADIVVGTESGTLTRLAGPDGVRRWERSVSTTLSAPLSVSDDGIFLTDGSTVFCVGPQDGARRWTLDARQASESTPDDKRPSGETETDVTAGPTLADQTVLFGTADGAVLALEVRDGQRHWRSQLSANTRVTAVAGDADNGAVFAATAAGQLYRLVLETGSVGWSATEEVSDVECTVTSGQPHAIVSVADAIYLSTNRSLYRFGRPVV